MVDSRTAVSWSLTMIANENAGRQSGIAAAIAASAGANRLATSRSSVPPQRGQGSPDCREPTAISQMLHETIGPGGIDVVSGRIAFHTARRSSERSIVNDRIATTA